MREYVSGDPLSRIHWVSTARRGRLIVKEFELDPLAEVWVFIDANQGAHSSKPYPKGEYDFQEFWRKRSQYELPPSTEEYAVSIAASLARYYLQRGRAVGLVSAGQSVQCYRQIAADANWGKFWRPWRCCAPKAISHLKVWWIFRRGTYRVAAQPSWLPPAPPSTSSKLRHLLRRGLRPVVVVIDSATFGGSSGPEKI